MIALAEHAHGTLEPTAGYAARAWSWSPAHGRETDERDGTLAVMLTEALKRGPRTLFFWYAVQVEWEAALDLGIRSFLLENEREPDEAGPFRCVVGDPAFEQCGCEAFRFGLDCKHRDALRALCVSWRAAAGERDEVVPDVLAVLRVELV